jgi:hypothetical protein
MLLNIVEELKTDNQKLREEVQRLRDENNRLKGEQGKPRIKANQPRKEKGDHSSEKERQKPGRWTKNSKLDKIQIDREEVLEVEESKLPADAEFKGYEEVVVQDISIKTDNVLFRKKKYYSALEKRTYLAELPRGYEGEFGPGVKLSGGVQSAVHRVFHDREERPDDSAGCVEEFSGEEVSSQ